MLTLPLGHFGGVDYDFAKYILDVTVTDGGTISDQGKAAGNKFVKRVKTAGLWGKLDRFNLGLGGSIDASRRPQKAGGTNARDVNNGGTPMSFAQGTGWTGNGIGYFDTTWNPTTHGSMSADDVSFGVYNFTASASATNELSAFTSSTSRLTLACRFADATNFTLADCYAQAQRLNSGNVTPYTGLIVATRRSSTDAELYIRGASVDTDTGSHSGTLVNKSMYFMGQNAGTPNTLSSRVLGGYFLGTKLTSAEVATLSTIWNDCMNELGRSGY